MEEKRRKSWWEAVSLAWQLGWVIAVPIVVLALLGRFLDKKLGTSPWLLLGGIFVSIVISVVGLVIQFQRIINQYKKDR